MALVMGQRKVLLAKLVVLGIGCGVVLAVEKCLVIGVECGVVVVVVVEMCFLVAVGCGVLVVEMCSVVEVGCGFVLVVEIWEVVVSFLPSCREENVAVS